MTLSITHATQKNQFGRLCIIIYERACDFVSILSRAHRPTRRSTQAQARHLLDHVVTHHVYMHGELC